MDVPLSNVLHVSFFSVNLLSISVIILQLNCIVSCDIQEKGMGQRLGTGI
jgi:hypothetical protein